MSDLARYAKFLNEVGRINELAEKEPKQLVDRADRRFHGSVRSIAGRIAQRGCSVVLLAGPTSSGKTTTAHLLADALEEMGHETQIISLDDFYKAEEDTPLLPDGRHDFEALDALRVDEVERCLRELMTRRSCVMPQFDFVHHQPAKQGRLVRLREQGIALVEGIHALNPALTRHLPKGGVARIYLSVRQPLCSGAQVLLEPSEVRLVRRVVRDYLFRGTGPAATLDMWPTVMQGERRYVRPFQDTADECINTLHAYEPGVLRGPGVQLLRQVQDAPHEEQAQRLCTALLLFAPLNAALLPRNSLIREFVGGGLYG